MFNKRLCFHQLALKTDTGRTAPSCVPVVKVSVTHGLASVPVLLAKWDLAVSKVTKRDLRSSCQPGAYLTNQQINSAPGIVCSCASQRLCLITLQFAVLGPWPSPLHHPLFILLPISCLYLTALLHHVQYHYTPQSWSDPFQRTKCKHNIKVGGKGGLYHATWAERGLCGWMGLSLEASFLSWKGGGREFAEEEEWRDGTKWGEQEEQMEWVKWGDMSVKCSTALGRHQAHGETIILFIPCHLHPVFFMIHIYVLGFFQTLLILCSVSPGTIWPQLPPNMCLSEWWHLWPRGWQLHLWAWLDRKMVWER